MPPGPSQQVGQNIQQVNGIHPAVCKALQKPQGFLPPGSDVCRADILVRPEDTNAVAGPRFPGFPSYRRLQELIRKGAALHGDLSQKLLLHVIPP